MSDLCVTRWVENLDGYSTFLVTLPFIVETLEVIGHKLHMGKYQEWTQNLEGEQQVYSVFLVKSSQSVPYNTKNETIYFDRIFRFWNDLPYRIMEILLQIL